MTRAVFQEHLTGLEKDLLTMGDMVTDAVNRSVTALKKRDLKEAKRIKKNDQKINDKRWEIEETCINLIATQQPVATDLRELIAILNIITDLERIGDYAGGIAKFALKIGDDAPVKPLIDIPRMAGIAVEMIDRSLKAYAARDNGEARLICDLDDQVDELYHLIYRELISVMIEDPGTVTRATWLIWVAHYLERIGDRVTNICERIIFLVTGEMVENVFRGSAYR